MNEVQKARRQFHALSFPGAIKRIARGLARNACAATIGHKTALDPIAALLA
jgi:hypothetical protein